MNVLCNEEKPAEGGIDTYSNQLIMGRMVLHVRSGAELMMGMRGETSSSSWYLDEYEATQTSMWEFWMHVSEPGWWHRFLQLMWGCMVSLSHQVRQIWLWTGWRPHWQLLHWWKTSLPLMPSCQTRGEEQKELFGLSGSSNDQFSVHSVSTSNWDTSDIDVVDHFSLNQSRSEEITLKEDFDNDFLNLVDFGKNQFCFSCFGTSWFAFLSSVEKHINYQTQLTCFFIVMNLVNTWSDTKYTAINRFSMQILHVILTQGKCVLLGRRRVPDVPDRTAGYELAEPKS